MTVEPPRAVSRPPGREPIRFFLPGPCYVLAEVRAQLTAPVVGHRSAAFRQLYAEIAPHLPPLFGTAREVYIATGSSTLVMEAAVTSAVRSSVLNVTCGSFSERWHTISRSLGKEADRLAVPWGQALDPELLRRALARKRYEAVTLVHNETSTGVIQPIAELAAAVREASDALVLVDAVSSLGGVEFQADAWGVDIALAGVQKAIAAPPGLVLVTTSERAEARMAKVPHRGFYTDLLRYRDQHRTGGSTITTPAVPLFYALARQLEIVACEGLAARFARHLALRERTAVWAEERGLEFASAAAFRSPTVSCLLGASRGSAPKLVRSLSERGFTLGGGYGDWKETTFRIGHMGEVMMADLEDLLAELDRTLAN